MVKKLKWMLLAVLVCTLMASGWFLRGKFQLSEQMAGTTVMTVLQKESKDQFLLGGKVEINTIITTKATTGFNLFGFHRFVIGQTDVEIVVPGEVSYGVDLKGFSEKNVTYDAEKEILTITLHAVSVYSAEPWLEKAQLRTTKNGSLQYIRPNAEKLAQEAAYAKTRFALRDQAAEYLRTNPEPRNNAAQAYANILAPALKAARMHVQAILFQFEDGKTKTITLTSKGGAE